MPADTCTCIYDPRLVESFRSTLSFERPTQNFFKDNFEDQGVVQQVSAMSEELQNLAYDPTARRKKLQNSLLIGLVAAPFSQYSMFHENSIYVNGYDAPDTIRNAFM